ncbi:MAG: hypothetical protein V2B19_24190, partial [Pseudomonadota bacterium]
SSFRPPPNGVKVTQGRFCKPGKLFERQRVLAGLEKMPLRGRNDDQARHFGRTFFRPASLPAWTGLSQILENL